MNRKYLFLLVVSVTMVGVVNIAMWKKRLTVRMALTTTTVSYLYKNFDHFLFFFSFYHVLDNQYKTDMKLLINGKELFQ